MMPFAPESLSFDLGERNPSTVLTHHLKDVNGVLEETGMEDWQCKLHESEMPNT